MQPDEVLLVDSSKLFREGLKRLLTESGFGVCGEAASIDEGIAQIEHGSRPRLLLFDYPSASRSEPGEQIRRLGSSSGEAKLVVLTTELNFGWVMTSLSAGVNGYLLKDMSPEAFIQSLRLVQLGERVLPTDLAMLLVSGRFQIANQIVPTMPAQNLSPREVQILHCLLRGDSNKLIANQLKITEGTVKVHLKGVLKKINVRNRTQAAIWALNNGFVGQTQLPPAAQDAALEERVT